MTVRLNDVRKRYGNVVALDGIDAVLDNGITGLLGPNGAGKTTLLGCLATVLAPDSGPVEADRLRPDRPSERTRDPPPHRLPPPGTRLLPQFQLFRLRRLRRHPQGARDRDPPRRGAPGARSSA